MTVTGTIDNGQRVDIDASFFRGRAGLRVLDNCVQLAYVGDVPSSLPRSFKIDGASFTAFAASKSGTAPSMVVVSARQA